MSQLLIRPFNALNRESPERLPRQQCINTPNARKATDTRTPRRAQTVQSRQPASAAVPTVTLAHWQPKIRRSLVSLQASVLSSKPVHTVSLTSTVDTGYTATRVNSACIVRLLSLMSTYIQFCAMGD